MALTPMYEGKNNSPQTDIAAAITAVDTTILVSDISVFPAAPNLATIGNEENAEVIRYNGISENTLTGIERGFGGTIAKPWESGTVISRQITKYDIDTIQDNIRDLESRKQEELTFDTTPTAESNNPVTSGGIKTALDEKQNTLTFDNTPSANSTNPVTSGGIKTALDAEILYYTSQTVSVATSSQIMRIPASGTNSKITTDTIPLRIIFASPTSIRNSNVSWHSYAGYITFSGTCSTATTATVILGKKGN